MKQSLTRRALIVANGEIEDSTYARTLRQSADLLIAVNGGSRHVWALGWQPDLVIGDTDSLPHALREWLVAHNVPQHRHPRDKEQTDLELALHHVAQVGVQEVLLLGVTGGRMDHTIANLSLLALAPALALRLEAVRGREHLTMIQDRGIVGGQRGETLSLLPWGGDVEGITTRGLKWELRDEALRWGPARGISNVLAAPEAHIALRTGTLLLCHHRGLLP